MKNTLCCIILTIFSLQSFAQERLTVGHDPRTELMSVVFYLAGAPEYRMSQYGSYRRDVDSYFAPYQNHEAVKYAQEMRKQHIGYDAVMHYALKLNWNKDLTLADDVEDVDEHRWTDKSERKMLSALKDFVKKTNFVSFYVEHEQLYTEANIELQKIVDQLDVSWYDRFFEPREPKNFFVLTSILNGPQNYSITIPKKNGKKEITVVMGGCKPSVDDHPTYSGTDNLQLLVHEFCHAYCNDLNSSVWTDMEISAQTLFQSMEKKMRAIAYGTPKIMMDETFVRSSVINYMISHVPFYDANAEINEETERGFLLSRKMVDLLGKRNIQEYPTMETYMPVVVHEVNAFDMEQFKAENDAMCGHLVSCSVEDGSVVNANLKTLVLTFDKPMDGNVSLHGGQNGEEFPQLARRDPPFSWTKNSTQLTLYLDLKPGMTYGFCVHSSFTCANGYPLDKSYYFTFKTK